MTPGHITDDDDLARAVEAGTTNAQQEWPRVWHVRKAPGAYTDEHLQGPATYEHLGMQHNAPNDGWVFVMEVGPLFTDAIERALSSAEDAGTLPDGAFKRAIAEDITNFLLSRGPAQRDRDPQRPS